MVKDDVIPALARIAPPESVTAAANRIRDCGGADTLYGLIGCVFLSPDQFVAGMRECGINCKVDEIMSNGTVTTHKATLLTVNGSEWKFLLNATGPFRLDVINCKMVREGDLDPQALEVLKDVRATILNEEI